MNVFLCYYSKKTIVMGIKHTEVRRQPFYERTKSKNKIEKRRNNLKIVHI